ncbi:DUF3332 family protein [Cysteiniphilum litorale]|uniref:DUF3332 family protein n=1 Tax=Cysteiniphilum litorale TaxID=2056700 RepID=UPI003F8817E8
MKYIKIFKTIAVVAILSTLLNGCIGQMGLTKAATGVNLKVVDNRYARAGVYVLASPVYAVTSFLDLFIFNPIEFWTGKNPITGVSPALADTNVNAWIKANEALPKQAAQVPFKSAQFSVQDTVSTN